LIPYFQNTTALESVNISDLFDKDNEGSDSNAPVREEVSKPGFFVLLGIGLMGLSRSGAHQTIKA